MHFSLVHGTPEGHHAPSMLWPGDGGTTCGREPSPARNRYVRNHNACPTQGARRLGPDLAGKDQPHYGDSDPDNHGRYPRTQDAQCSPSPDACGPQAFVKRIQQTSFLACFHMSSNIVKYSGDTNLAVWLEDFYLAYRAGGVDDDLIIIQYLPLNLMKSTRA